MRRLLVTGDQQWASLKNVKTDILHFRGMWDIHPFNGPVVDAKIVVFDDCDKNFVYYWAIPRVLPSAKHVYLFSHPCEPVVFRTLNKMGVTVRMNEHWQHYAMRWAPAMIGEGKIKIIKDVEAKNFLNTLDRSFPN